MGLRRRLVAALASGLVAGGLAVQGWALEPAAPRAGRVIKVSDGDSLWLKPSEGGRPVRVRLQGVDAPEICQPGGEQARQALAALVLDKTVQWLPQGRDDYGRTLARLRVAGAGGSLDVGARLVADGMAWSYRFHDDPGPYAAEEARSRGARRGLHAQASPELPREFRRRHGPCSTPPR